MSDPSTASQERGDAGRPFLQWDFGGKPSMSLPQSRSCSRSCEPEASGREESAMKVANRPEQDRLHGLLRSRYRAESQTTLPATVTTGSQAAGDDEACRHPASTLDSEATTLRLSNPSNHCFINASMVSMMWASLQRRRFAITDWGMLQDSLSLLVKRGEEPTLVQGMLFFAQKLPDGMVLPNVTLRSSL